MYFLLELFTCIVAFDVVNLEKIGWHMTAAASQLKGKELFFPSSLLENLLLEPNFQVNLKNIEYLKRVLRGTGSVLYHKSLGHIFEPFQTSPPFSFK